jgi:alcohol dehydrogenase (cytochrome c)
VPVLTARRFVRGTSAAHRAPTSLLSCILLVLGMLASAQVTAESLPAGKEIFEHRCSMCHGADGNGGEFGPGIVERIANFTDDRIQTTVAGGLSNRGMPPVDVNAQEMPQLIAYLRMLRPKRSFEPYRTHAHLTNGNPLEGMIVAEGMHDVQMLADDGRLRLLRRAGSGTFREVTSETDWTTYNGDAGGNRFTALRGIGRSNVGHVVPRWIFNMPNASRLEATPIVANGIMYVTNGNECFALDAGSGRPIWHYQRPRTRGLIGNAASGINRGVALANGKVFMVTDDAHLLALNSATGDLLWDTQLADWHNNYNATSAPLVVDDLILTGSAGGEEGARGFLAAFDQSGKEVWRFWTVPARGDPAAQTWAGGGIDHGGAVTWLTGVYDAETDTVFWPTGNPGNDYNGDDRGGDNLYSDCILALDPKTGKLKWYYQTTPHDVWDWDASETPLVIDTLWKGRRRKLLAQGNRNGFFYVFDRTTGELLLTKQFARMLTWASGIGPDGRPIKTPGQEPSVGGTRVCPAQSGATNWYAPSFSPDTDLFYMQTNEKCSIFYKKTYGFEYGRAFLGGTQRIDSSPKPERILRALDLQSGVVKWETHQVGASTSSGGTLATKTGLVFFGDDSGAFAAADAATGKTLWSYELGVNWRASPMAYRFDGKELIGVAAGGNIIVFGLPD